MANQTFSYWEQTSFIDNSDVIVIGSGLVGLSAALRLKKKEPNLNVLVLERGFLPTGASTKNAGFACFGTASEQLDYLQKTSENEVLKLVDYKWRGLQKLRENLGDENIDYQQHGGYELFMDSESEIAFQNINQIDRINNLLKDAIGTKDIYRLANHKISTFGFNKICNIIYNPFEGQVNTGKMMRTLIYKATQLGIMVLNNCEIYKIAHEANAVNLFTNVGNFKTSKAILATNAFANQLFPSLKVTPGRGQVLITKPIKSLKLKGTYHFDDGYYYFRNIDDQVLFGGGRNLDFNAEATYEFGQTDLVKNKLTTYLKEVILPNQQFEIDYWWSGIMGFGDEISPIVKLVEPNVYCAVRCNGMGVAMGSLVGEEVADLLLKN